MADELTMPAQEGRRLYQERPPQRSRQHLTERRQHTTIGGLDARARDLAPEHVQLVPENEDLQFLRPLTASAKPTSSSRRRSDQ